MKSRQKIGLSNLRRADNARSGTDMDGACRKRPQKLASEVLVSQHRPFPEALGMDELDRSDDEPELAPQTYIRTARLGPQTTTLCLNGIARFVLPIRILRRLAF